MVGSKLYFKFTEEDGWEEKITNLVAEIKNLGVQPKSSPTIVIPPSPSAFPSPSPSPVTLPPAIVQNQIISWKEKEVGEWLTKCGLEKLIPVFKKHEFSGSSLSELRDVVINHRQEYFSLLKEMGVSIGVTLHLAAHLKLLQ